MKKLPRFLVAVIFGLVVAIVLAFPTSWFVVTLPSQYEGPPGGYQILTEAAAQTSFFIVFAILYSPVFVFLIYKFLGKLKK